MFAASIMLITCVVSTSSIDTYTSGAIAECDEMEHGTNLDSASDTESSSNTTVLVICNNDDFVRNRMLFSNISKDVEIVDHMSGSISADVIFIDSAWYSDNSDATSNKIIELLMGGKTIASIGSTAVFRDSGIECFAFSDNPEESDINMMSYNARPGTYCCYTSSYVPDSESKRYCMTSSPTTESDRNLVFMSERIDESIDRFEQISKPKPATRSIDMRMDVEKSIKRIFDVQCGRHGTFSVNTEHYKLKETDPDYNYYLSEYHLTTIPNKKDLRGTADITIRSSNFSDGSRLFRFEPNTTNGITTVSFSIKPSEFFSGFSYSHSYATSDVVVHNKCDPSKGLFEIWHDVNEMKGVGKDSYYVEPAKLVIVDSKNAPGIYKGTDSYKVDFCTFLGFGSNPLAPVAFKWYEKQDTVQLQ